MCPKSDLYRLYYLIGYTFYNSFKTLKRSCQNIKQVQRYNNNEKIQQFNSKHLMLKYIINSSRLKPWQFRLKCFSSKYNKSIFLQEKENLIQMLQKQDINVSQTQPEINRPEEAQQHQQITQQQIIKAINTMHEQDYFQLIEPIFQNSQTQPQILIYLLGELQIQDNILKVLYALYKNIDSLSDHNLLFVFQKILAYQPQTLPAIPTPRPLQNIQLLLLCLAEIYSADKLIGWMESVKIWDGEDDAIEVIAMGVFTIYNKLTEVQLNKYHKECTSVLESLFLRVRGSDLQTFINVTLLSLELYNPIAIKLLELNRFTQQDLQIQKICLLLINLTRFNSRTSKRNKIVDSLATEIITYLITLNFEDFLKLTLYMQFWRILYLRNDGIYARLMDKLISFSCKQLQTFHLYNLSAAQLTEIIEVLQHAKINNKGLLIKILTYLNPQVQTLDKQSLIRLVKSLITYIRQVEDFYINLRRIIERRKIEFTSKQIKQMNEVYDRCRILFSKPLLISNTSQSIQYNPNYIKNQNIPIQKKIDGKILPLSNLWEMELELKIGQQIKITKFIIDTGSTYNYLKEEYFISKEAKQIQCHINGIQSIAYQSREYYKEYNIIGSKWLVDNQVNLITNISQKRCSLIFNK